MNSIQAAFPNSPPLRRAIAVSSANEDARMIRERWPSIRIRSLSRLLNELNVAKHISGLCRNAQRDRRSRRRETGQVFAKRLIYNLEFSVHMPDLEP